MHEVHESDSVLAARLNAEGRALLEDRRFSEAGARLEQARALAPNDPGIHYNLGLLFSDTGRAAEALAAYETSLHLNPNDAKVHNNRGSVLQVLGRSEEAGNSFRRALELAPDLELPYINLGKLLELQGDAQLAVDVYDLAISRGLDFDLFAQYRAVALGQSTQRSPDRWVTTTFDNFAPTFDAHLDSLQYDVPRRLAALLRPRLVGPAAILDLGCGTGQVGVAMAAPGCRLVGVDLSPKMLAQAAARNLYDQLQVGEIHAWLREAESEMLRCSLRCRRADLYRRARDTVSRCGANSAQWGMVCILDRRVHSAGLQVACHRALCAIGTLHPATRRSIVRGDCRRPDRSTH